MMEPTPKVGLAGAGRWGLTLVRQLRSMGIQVDCYPGRTASSRRRAGELEGVTIVERLDDLLSNRELGAILFATPPETHASLARAALEAGKHTFVEKPLCLQADEVPPLFDLAQANAVVLFTGYTVMHHPVVRELARLSDAARLRSLWSSRTKTGSFASDIVSTLLVHDLAVADRLTGGLTAWSLVDRAGPPGRPDAVSLSFETGSGGGGLLRADRVAPESRRELGVWIGDDVYRWDGGSALLRFEEGRFEPAFTSPESALGLELRAFLDAVSAGTLDPQALARERRLAKLAVDVRTDVLS